MTKKMYAVIYRVPYNNNKEEMSISDKAIDIYRLVSSLNKKDVVAVFKANFLVSRIVQGKKSGTWRYMPQKGKANDNHFLYSGRVELLR